MFKGQLTGVDFPGDIASFKAAGTAFLTEAFRATGVLKADNHVASIIEATEFFGGGLGGTKLYLQVAYARPAPNLVERLFVKLQIPIGHPWREKFAPVMEPEMRFALLSLRSDFPIRVPRCYFADYHAETHSAILITERIAYGEAGIEPVHDKCLDYLLDNPYDHYRAMARELATLAGYHRTGGFGEDVAGQFAFDVDARNAARLISFTSDELHARVEALKSFAAKMPQLFPPSVSTPEFLEKFGRTGALVLQKESKIHAYLNSQQELIALCHWNLNIDNAWFWRDESHRLRCGVLDWGGVSKTNIAHGFFGMTCAAGMEFLAAHEADLMAYFLEEYRRHGGPSVDPALFERCVRLASAVKGIAWMLDGFLDVGAELAALDDVRDAFDPRINDTFRLRAAVQMFMTFLVGWKRADMPKVMEIFCT